MAGKKRQIIAYGAKIILAFATMLAFAHISHFGITGIDFLLPCVFALCLIVYIKAGSIVLSKDKWKAKTGIISLVLGFICGIAATVGSCIDMETRTFTSFSAIDIFCMIILIPFFAAAFVILFFSSDVHTLTQEHEIKKGSCYKRFFIYMAVMLICWLPYYLTYFPGGVGNDDFECARMCLGIIPWTNHNPIFYIFLMNLFFKVTGYNLTASFGIMAFIQMLMLSATLGLLLIWLYRKNISGVFLLVSLAFFSLHPIVAIYSIYVTKDIMFSCVVILETLFLLDLSTLLYRKDDTDIPKKIWVILGILSLLTIITRNNGIFMIAFLAVGTVISAKKFRKELIITFLAVFLLNGIYKGPVWKMCGVSKQSFAESASIPLSQVAYTICNDGKITGEDRVYLEELMPFDKVKEEYEPGYTDSYKFSDSFDKELLDSDPGKFMKTWLHLLPGNFKDYVEVYLMQTSGYWHYGITNTVATQGVEENELGIEGHDLIDKTMGFSLDGLMTELILVARKLPVLCMLSQMAIEILAVILAVINCVRKNRKAAVIAFVPLLALWISVMIATPAYCLFRYLCPIFFMWPMLISAFFANEAME